MLLGFAGRNKSGRKTELQQRAFDLLRTKQPLVYQKIRELNKTMQLEWKTNAGSGESTEQTIYNSGNMLPSSSGPGMWQMSTLRARQAQNNVMNTAVPTGRANELQAPSLAPQATVAPQQQIQQASQPRATVYPLNYGAHQQVQDNRHQNCAASRVSYNQMYARYASTPTPINTYPVHPDVVFKRLPFFDHLGDLIKPSSLIAQTAQRIQETPFIFHLTPGQATDIASNRDVRPGAKLDFLYQVQLRFCLLETSCEQDDFFPPGVSVKVNNKVCPLPNPIPTNKPGVEPKRPPKPVNITPMVKLSPTVPNHISVGWAAEYGKGYVIRVSMVRKLTAPQLLGRLKAKGIKHADHTTGLIKEKLSEDADSEIATTSLRVSLLCPLGKSRMSVPCRATTCNHLQCFDASVYLDMNERRATWTCPVCDKPALYDNLVIDGYFQDVLVSPKLGQDVTEIELHKDGSWQVHIAAKKEVNSISKEDGVEIISDDIEVIPIISNNNNATAVNTTKLVAPKTEEKKPPVVDLTLSDSDDDDVPLRRKIPVQKQPDSTKRRIDTSSVSSSSSSRYTVTPGPSSVSSSGYQSPSVITLDSPSPPLD